jgi:hypothetical protein|tara:strand:+ start:805 stop:1554 length:750 start_codon:yes stop_codon:yes gene_type:complete
MILSSREAFYINGFAECEIVNKYSSDKIIKIAEEIVNNNIKENYFLEEKYRGTRDLRPYVYNYDKCFFSFLKENKIVEKIKKLTGSLYLPYHLQLRYTTCNSRVGKNSYMDWHRDAYMMNGKILGRLPPPIKLIFYPALNDKEINKARLKIVPNSHTIQMHSDQLYTSRFGAPINNLDSQLISGLEHKEIKTSNDSYTLFNTAMLHGAIHSDDYAPRVIYTFILEDQFNDNCDDHHKETKRYYQNLQDS